MCLYFFCIRSLVRHLSNTTAHFTRAFPYLSCLDTQDAGDGVNARCWLVVFSIWYISSSEVEPSRNRPCDVSKKILLNIINTRQFKIRQKQLRNLFYPTVIFFVTKFHVLAIMPKATSEIFSSYQRNRPIPTPLERYQSQNFVSTELWLWWHQTGFHWVRLDVFRKEQYHFFSLSEQ